MRALWHLAINNLAGRRGRTALLVAAVALAALLTVGVAAAVGTLSRSVRHVVGRVMGLADVHVRHRFGGPVPEALLPQVRAWPDVALAAGSAEGGVTLHLARTDRTVTALLHGIEPGPRRAPARPWPRRTMRRAAGCAPRARSPSPRTSGAAWTPPSATASTSPAPAPPPT